MNTFGNHRYPFTHSYLRVRVDNCDGVAVPWTGTLIGIPRLDHK